jgi:hypothetical protein
MLNRTLVLFSLCLLTLLASYLFTRASRRSAIWNIVVGGIVVLILAVVLLLTSPVLVRRAFR